MRDDDRQRTLVLRADVHEVDVHTVDGGQVREGVQSRLDRAPVVVGRPVARGACSVASFALRRSVTVSLSGSALPRCGGAGRRSLVEDLDAEGTDRIAVVVPG
jgi:hypothetical protein